MAQKPIKVHDMKSLLPGRSTAINGMLCMALGVFASDVLAAQAVITAYVNKVSIRGDGYGGGCLASLSVDPKSKLATCKPGWVAFSCDGMLLDQALAFPYVRSSATSACVRQKG